MLRCLRLCRAIFEEVWASDLELRAVFVDYDVIAISTH